MSNYSVLSFFNAKMVFPLNIRHDIAKYLILLFIFACVFSSLLLFTGEFNLISIISFYTMGVILMPFFLYFGYTIKRVAKEKGKSKEEKTKVKYWLFSKMIFNLMTIIITYLYLTVLLLTAILLITIKVL